MSVAIDANLLVYASDESSSFHRAARARLGDLVAGPGLVYLFWPVAMAYVRVITHPSIVDRPLAPADARGNLRRLLSVPHVRSPGEQEGFWPHFEAAAADADARGNLVSDAHIVALMRQHDVPTIWTNDRDFRRFTDIDVHDPFA